MVFVRPWDEKSKQILERLIKDERVYIDDPMITRSFGRRYPELFDKNKGFADIGNIWRRKESVFVLRPGKEIVKKGKKYHFL